MLVLTRKKGQKLIINDNIEIVILETKGDSIKVGIKAPKNVSIFREEVYEEIKKANQQSIKESSTNELDAISGMFSLPTSPKIKSVIKLKGQNNNK